MGRRHNHRSGWGRPLVSLATLALLGTGAWLLAPHSQWLLERAQKHGFSLDPEEFTVTKVRWLHFPKAREGGRLVTLLAVTYEGTLRVTDPELFQALLVNGIGRGKAYGLGLMTVMGRR